MSQSARSVPIVRSILAVLAGYFAMVMTVVVLTVVTMAAFHLKSGHPTASYLAANVVYSIAAAVLGGYITGRIAKAAQVAHGAALAALMLVLGLVLLRHPAPGQPLSYLVLLTVTAPVAAVAGAYIASRSTAASSSNQATTTTL